MRRLAAWLLILCLMGLPSLGGVWASSRMSCARTGKGHCCCKKQSPDGGTSVSAPRCAEKCCQTPASPVSPFAPPAPATAFADCQPAGCAAPVAGTAFVALGDSADLYQRPPPSFSL